MKTRTAIILLFSLVFFGNPLEAKAENSFTAREILRGQYLFLQTANSKGWLLAEESVNGELRSILIGPRGYRRDLTDFMPVAEPNRGTYATSISNDGTVFFETTSFTDEGVLLEKKLFSLARESIQLTLIADLSRKGSIFSNASVNNNGDVLIVDSSESGSNDTVGIRTLKSGESLQRSLSFPNRIKRGGSSVVQFIDNEGRFILARDQVTKHRRKLIDICTGTLHSNEISCATPDKIAQLAYRGKGYISTFSEGKLLVDKMGSFNLVDATTFEVIKSFHFPSFNSLSTYAVGQDLSIIGLDPASSRRSPKTHMTIINPLVGGQKYSCDFIPKDSTFLLPFTQILQLTSSHIYLVVDGIEEKSGEYTKVLYELTISETNFQNSAVVGGCLPIKRRAL